MKERWLDRVLSLLFCTILAGMALGYLLLPERTYSELEKRYLQQRPTFSWEMLTSGEFSENMENYMADHIPGRSFLVGLNAYFEQLTLRQAEKEIYVAEGGRLVEAPTAWNQANAEKNMASVNEFTQKIGKPVCFTLIPSGGWAAKEKIQGIAKPYRDETLIEDLYAMAEQGIETVNLTETFARRSDLFFKTDHHWNSRGAYEGSACILQHFGREQVPESTFQNIDGGEFRGSNYTRSCLWFTQPEQIMFWQSNTPLSVTNEDSTEPHDGALYWENLNLSDKYTVNLDGNHSLIHIANPNGTGKLLVIRDSFANSMGAFLAESYQEVVLVDLRYYKGAVSELMAESFTDVLICYSLSNFLTDTNLVWLR